MAAKKIPSEYYCSVGLSVRVEAIVPPVMNDMVISIFSMALHQAGPSIVDYHDAFLYLFFYIS